MPRRRWGQPVYSSLAEHLLYDKLFKEWWDQMGPSHLPKEARDMLNNNNNTTKTGGSQVSHTGRELDQIGRMWSNTSAKGTQYLRGYLDDGRVIMLFAIKEVVGNGPQYTLHVARYTDEEREILAEEQEKMRQAMERKQQAQESGAEAPGFPI